MLTRPRKMPKQKPHRSIQTVETPWELIDVVERRWGGITFDLAATKQNCKVRARGGRRPNGVWFGPGSDRGEDALAQDWTKLRGNLWLNPEFGDIGPWAQKCFMSIEGLSRTIFLLVPASVGSNWWSDWVDRGAAVKFLSPRVIFVGHTQSYPKDLALCVYVETPGYECWRWK